jgi:glycosyltransferase involved in cell wall biosynthesis
MNKKRIALIGPIRCQGGIATVINAMTSSSVIQDEYDLLFFNSSNYKDSSAFGNLFVFLWALFRFKIKLLAGKIDVAHIHTSYGLSFYRKAFFIFLSSLFGVKTVLHFHSSRFDDFFIEATGFRRRLIKFFLSKPDALILLCRDWKEKIEKSYSVQNAAVIHNPVPIDVEQTAGAVTRNGDGVKALFLGFLIKSKGIYDMIEMAKKFETDALPIKIIVGGKGEEEKNFLQKIKDENLSNLEYMGWVSGEQKINLYKGSDLLLLPSYKEGMPMVILEGMSFGLPVVSSNIAGIPDMVVDGENGYLLAPGDIDGYVEKITKMVQDPFLRKKFGEKSRTVAENFKKDKISLLWHQLYQTLVEEK